MAEEDLIVPANELVKKIHWIYGNVPYLFAYAACGYLLDLYILTKKGKELVASYNLKLLPARLQFFLALVHISRLFPLINSLCPKLKKPEFNSMIRNGKTIHFFKRSIKKQFHAKAKERVDHLINIYNRLEAGKVTNVDRLLSKPKRDTVSLGPLGEVLKPTSISDEVELLRILEDILKALVGLHGLSEPIMHRDIRWSNIMKKIGKDEYFLIDFDEASVSDRPNSPEYVKFLSKEEHAPEIFNSTGTHTTAVDMWSVGYLIKGCSHLDLSKNLKDLSNTLLNEDPSKRLNPEATIDIVRKLINSYKISMRESKRQKAR